MNHSQEYYRILRLGCVTLLDGNERMSNSSKRKDKLALKRLNISRSTGNLSMTSLTNARSRERERGEERSRDKEGRKSRNTTTDRRNDRYRKKITTLEQTKDKDVIIVNDVRRFMKLYIISNNYPHLDFQIAESKTIQRE